MRSAMWIASSTLVRDEHARCGALLVEDAQQLERGQ